MPAGAPVPAAADIDAPAETVDYPEGSARRVATLTPEAGWVLGGEDADRFFVDAGALRFRGPDGTVLVPDHESPRDRDGDNRYEVTLALSGAFAGDGAMDSEGPLRRRLTVRVTDRDEPGRVVLSTGRPVRGEPLRAEAFDPDGIAGTPAWTWQRWRGLDRWDDIAGATGPDYTPTAADTGRYLRATACWGAGNNQNDGTGRCASAMAPEPVLGPLLADLSAGTGEHPGAGLHPAFDPRIAHYAVPCAERDVLTVSFGLPPGTRAAVDGVRPQPGLHAAAARAVNPGDRVRIELAAPDGARSVYTVHCMAPEVAALRPVLAPGSSPPGELLALVAGPWLAVIDGHGVPRLSRHAGGPAGFFLLPFRHGEERFFAHAEQNAPGNETGNGKPGWRWVVRDGELSPLRTVTTALPLTRTGRHDFSLLPDGGALLMAYEPRVGDLRPLNALGHRDVDGNPWGGAVEVLDSVIQIVGPDADGNQTPRWTWGAWGRIPLEDCTGHWFPGDYAHVNSVQWTVLGILASFRGCSTVLMLDPEAPAGEEIVWRLGRSNLGRDDWAARGLGPPPLAVVGDPAGIFCGQHAVQLLGGAPEPRLLMFDNGVACVPDPATGKPLDGKVSRSSRVVEYALDLEHGEAVFVRHRMAEAGSSPVESPGSGSARAEAGTASRPDAAMALGKAGGHVAVLDDSRWLIGWGFGGPVPEDPAVRLPADLMGVVDPESGRRALSIPRTVLSGAGSETGSDIERLQKIRELRPVPVDPLMLAVPPVTPTAFFPDLPPAAHGGGPVDIAVAFSRPVAGFGPDTASVRVSGGVLAAAAPDLRFGRPANGWLLTVVPNGTDDVALRLEAGVPCHAGGICPADGEPLVSVPPEAFVIPFKESNS